MVKFTLASVALLATGANAYSSFTQSRSTLKTGMPKVMASSTGSRKRVGVSSLRMEGESCPNTYAMRFVHFFLQQGLYMHLSRAEQLREAEFQFVAMI
mmetsp:Transcript_15424/g.23919  ORF Transcript_15424/g.23919 Transcript_15424/m.23919 type:complete len:98 (-) Transcript_15424:125-418(-)